MRGAEAESGASSATLRADHGGHHVVYVVFVDRPGVEQYPTAVHACDHWPWMAAQISKEGIGVIGGNRDQSGGKICVGK